ncbi:hypothetical protein N8077_04295 [Myxococcota bacterium]|nr:hypothetical protein [Myxococcota bacterium]
MEEVIFWAGIVVVALTGIWAVVKKVVAATPTTSDDEAIAKAAPYVDTVLDVAEKALASTKDVPPKGTE